MKAQLSTGALALGLLLAGCGGGDGNATANTAAPLEQIAAPNGGNWAEVVTQTPEGGFRMGNPDAPVKLVEYASMTCPHCKAFSDQASASLRDTYVRSGQVSWEFRNFLLGGPDLVLSLLSRCQPPAAYFGTIEQVFAQQTEFLMEIDETESRALGAMPPEQQIGPLARAMDLDTFFARRGMPEARFSQCLADQQAIRGLTERTQRASTEEGVSATPTFFINGEQQQASNWAMLEPQLRAAIGN